MAGQNPDDLEPAERAILEAIRGGKWACAAAASLVRAGSAAGGKGTGKAAVARLVADGWIAEWRHPSGGPAIMTLTPLGAERCDWALIQPAKDSDDEPTWGRAGVDPEEGVYDHPIEGTGRPVGLYASEPGFFIAELEWPCLQELGIRRSLTRFEKIARSRAAKERAATEAEVLTDEEGEAVVLFGQVVKRDKRLKPGAKTLAKLVPPPTPANKLKPKDITKAVVVAAYLGGKTAPELAKVFKVGESTIRRWARETG